MTGDTLDLDELPPGAALAALCARGETRRTAFADGQVVWRIWGTGPPLVLLHGGYGSWAHWVRAIEPLAAHYRLLAPDMPGFGESDAPPPPHDAESIMAPLADGLEGLLAADERPAIAGFSFGGVIAGHLAARFGARTAALLLVGPGGLGAPRGRMADLVPRHAAMSAAEVEAAHRRNLEILMLADPARVDALSLHIQRHNTATHRVKSRPISATDTLARALTRVSAPLAAVWGEADATARGHLRERAEILRAIRPNVAFRIMPGVGHWAMYEAPQDFATLALELLGAGSDPA